MGMSRKTRIALLSMALGTVPVLETLSAHYHNRFLRSDHVSRCRNWSSLRESVTPLVEAS